MLLFKKLLIFLIVSLFDFLEWNNVTITNTNTIRKWSNPTEFLLNIQTRIPKHCFVKMEKVSKEYYRRGAGWIPHANNPSSLVRATTVWY